jgi:hypothetical protein
MIYARFRGEREAERANRSRSCFRASRSGRLFIGRTAYTERPMCHEDVLHRTKYRPTLAPYSVDRIGSAARAFTLTLVTRRSRVRLQLPARYESNMSTRPMELERYQRMKMRVADYTAAIASTNLAARCWTRRVGTAGLRKEGNERSLVLVWLLTNHILQLGYRRAGVDVLPDFPGGGYGYAYSVGRASSCLRGDLGALGGFTFASLTLQPPKVSGPSKVSTKDQLTKAVAKGQDPLWAVDRAAEVVLGTRWLRRCHADGCAHREDHRAYLVMSNIVTLAVALGHLHFAILGPDLDSDQGTVSYAPAAISDQYYASPKELYANWFELGRDGGGPTIWIDRKSGLLTRKNGTTIPFQVWSRGEVDHGLKTIVELVSG